MGTVVYVIFLYNQFPVYGFIVNYVLKIECLFAMVILRVVLRTFLPYQQVLAKGKTYFLQNT